jgi:dephospho-CoA kinase
MEEHEGQEIVGLECAILFEAGFADTVDAVVTVYAPEALRVERAMKRDGATEAQIRARIAAQMDDEEKCRLSDYIIYNDGSISLENQLSALVAQLKKGK